MSKKILEIAAPAKVYLLLLAAILLVSSACAHNPQPNHRKDSEELEIFSMRNPGILIQKSMAFTWLPESIKTFDGLSLEDFKVQETVQKAIIGSLSLKGFVLKESESTDKTLIDSETSGANTEPEDMVLIKSWKWGGSFGAGGFLNEITLDNRGTQDVKDIKIRIEYLGISGPKQGVGGPTSVFVIQDVLPAETEKTFKNINVGFRHPDARKEYVRVLGVKTITYDLLIGYTFVSENALDDRDINGAYDIAWHKSDTDETREYSKGTLIIDVIDAETRILAWRGSALTLTSFDIPEDEKLKRIELAARKLIDDFILSND